MKTNILSAIRRDLDQQADANTQESFQSFFKEKVTAYGVRAAIVTKIGRKYFQEVKPLGKREIFTLCEETYAKCRYTRPDRDSEWGSSVWQV
jgi:3-methyladenine DNA glycosylase AlkD